MLFELGPYIRNEKKSKGDKAIRFRFPYVKNHGKSGVKELSIKVVIVTTFKDIIYDKMDIDNKMIVTFKQVGLLAMSIFSRAITFCYEHESSILMSPMCGAIFSRETITDMAMELGIENVHVIEIINESTIAGGQYWENSDIACAIVSMISATKRVSDKNIRNAMIAKTVKQYSNKFSKYALGGVLPGLDPETLISTYNNVQSTEVTLRARAKALTEAQVKVNIRKDGATKPTTTKSPDRKARASTGDHAEVLSTSDRDKTIELGK